MNVRKPFEETIIGDLKKCVNAIKDLEIREFVDFALDDISPMWWEIPSSPSLRYHPPENNLRPLGLVVHTIKAFHVAQELYNFYGITDELEKDIIRSSVILHDIMKCHPNWEGTTVPDHSLLAANWLRAREFNGSDYTKQQILDCVALHNSRWTYPARELAKATTPTKLERIVQMADYIASRKSLSFYPASDIRECEQNG